jgi:exonuclease III
MKGVFWNIRGLNRFGRNLSLGSIIRDNGLDFMGVQETKKEEFIPSFLKNLITPATFQWHFLSAKRTAGGILLGVRKSLGVSNVSILKYCVSCMLMDKRKNFSWRLVVVYGPPL